MTTTDLSGIRFIRLGFACTVLEKVVFNSTPSFALRSGFGLLLKRISCVSKTETCGACILAVNCAYAYIFETPVPEGSKRMKLYEHAPHPFALYMPNPGQSLPEDGRFYFEITLIGRAVPFLPQVVYAFMELGSTGLGSRIKGRRGRFSVQSVVDTFRGETIYAGDDGKLKNIKPLSVEETARSSPAGQPARLEMEFLSPLRLQYSEQIARTVEFHMIIRSLVRRLASLAYFHEGIEPSMDFENLINNAMPMEKEEDGTAWSHDARYSSRQKQRMELGGVAGKMVFRGNFSEEYYNIIALGEYVQVGKNTSFGLGRYSFRILY